MLKLLENEMNVIVENNGGIEEVLSHYDVVYSATFKEDGEFTLGSVDKESLKEYIIDDIQNGIIHSLMEKAGVVCDASADYWYDSNEDLVQDIQDSLTDDVVVVGLCNYKGEGEGFAVASSVQHLQTFTSKHESFKF